MWTVNAGATQTSRANRTGLPSQSTAGEGRTRYKACTMENEMTRGKSYGEQNGKNPKAGAAAPTGKRRRHSGNVANPADWGSVDAEQLQRAIESVTATGAAIRFGYTRDMGAYAVGFYENGESETEYVPPSEDMSLWLQGVIEDYGK